MAAQSLIDIFGANAGLQGTILSVDLANNTKLNTSSPTPTQATAALLDLIHTNTSGKENDADARIAASSTQRTIESVFVGDVTTNFVVDTLSFGLRKPDETTFDPDEVN